MVRHLQTYGVSFSYTLNPMYEPPAPNEWLQKTTGLRALRDPLTIVHLKMDRTLRGDRLEEVIRDVRHLSLPLFVYIEHPGPIVDDLQRLPSSLIRNVYITNRHVPVKAIRALQGLTNLKRLSLTSCILNDEAFVQLGNLSGLETLVLNRSSLNDSHIRFLSRLGNLTELGLYENSISDEAKQKLLQALPNLRIINVWR